MFYVLMRCTVKQKALSTATGGKQLVIAIDRTFPQTLSTFDIDHPITLIEVLLTFWCISSDHCVCIICIFRSLFLRSDHRICS